MAHSEAQKDKILLNLEIEEAKKKGKSKWYVVLLCWLVVLISLGWFLFCSFFIVGGFCKQGGIDLKGMGLIFPIFVVLLLFVFAGKAKGERKKGQQIEKPEYERKTGKGDFRNYFTCQGCHEEYRVNAEGKKNRCQRCSK